MGKDAGRTVCWHGVEVRIKDGRWVHTGSGTDCDDPAPFATPPAK